MLIGINGPILYKAIQKSTNPDEVCKHLNFCDEPRCSLYPPSYQPNVPLTNNNINQCYDYKGGFTQLALVEFLDSDQDSFSATKVSNFKDYQPSGSDCNDINSNIYPGRKIDPYPGKGIDYNCNGISGIDPVSGKSRKEALCKDSKQLGVILIGETSGTNFHIPPSWFNSSEWKEGLLHDVIPVVQRIFSVFQLGGFTGTCPDGSAEPCRSVHKYLTEWNKCNTEDFINLARPGATAKTMLSVLKYFPRNQDLDHPVVVFLGLFSFDECNRTLLTSGQFRDNFFTFLKKLDGVLPMGSHLVVIGMNEDDVYERMHSKIHPSGVTYDQFYKYAECLETPHCHSLLSSSKEMRQPHLERAQEFNYIYREGLKRYFTLNYDAVYYDFPLKYLERELAKEGRDSSEIYDAIDGYHLSQRTNAMLADYFWSLIKRDHSDWIGPKNRFNEEIEKLSRETIEIIQ